MKGFVLEWYPGYPDSNESTGILACLTAQGLVDECARLVHMYGDQVKLTVKEVEWDEAPFDDEADEEGVFMGPYPTVSPLDWPRFLHALTQAAVADARAQMNYTGPGVGKTCFLPTDDEVPS